MSTKKPPYAEQLNPAEAFHASRERVAEALEVADPALEEIVVAELLNRRHEDLQFLSPADQAARLISASKVVLPEAELKTRLEESRAKRRPLEVKYGIDPTGAAVHLGHAVPIILLERLQRMGHNVTVIIGDYTTSIGDPSGRVTERPILSDEQIRANFATYTEQIAPLLDMSNVRVVRNSEWLNGYSMKDLLLIGRHLKVAEILQREDYRGRLGAGMTLSEILYPVAMGVDSVELKTDIEVGGQDQLLNMQMCREVMANRGMRPEVIISTGLVLGTTGTGQKMSKSLDNFIALNHTPTDVYGRVMSIPDNLTYDYFGMFTEIEPSELAKLAATVHPMLAKKILARTLTAIIHGPEVAAETAESFESRFSRRDYAAATAGSIAVGMTEGDLTELLRAHRGGTSNKELQRLFSQNGVQVVDEAGNRTPVASVAELQQRLADDPTLTVVKIGKTVLSVTR